ncbi:MAG: apolipoprotein N-acyltransferase, partial [Pseudomonadota bacterium]
KFKAPLLAGSPACIQEEKGEYSYYNSAYLIAPGGEIKGRYDKTHLVPFGEYVPLRRWFPFLGKIVEAVGDFSSGEKNQPLLLGNRPVGVLICFEIVFTELGRNLKKNGAELLVTITNDAWFGTSSAPYQHLSMAVFRGIENRVAIARSANTGISALIDPAGRIIKQTHLFQDASISGNLPLMTIETLYTHFGYVLPMLSIIITLWLIYR